MAQVLPFVIQENKEEEISLRASSVYIKICHEAKEIIKISNQIKIPFFRNLLERTIFFWKKLFHQITIQTIESGKIYIIPPFLLDKKSPFIKKVIEKDILRIAEKEIYTYLVLPKEYEYLYHTEKLNDCQDKVLFQYMIYDAVQYMIKLREETTEECEIYITVSQNNKLYTEIILYLANYFKSIHIVTNHIEQFSILEEDLYTRKGFIMTVANNKRKSLLRAKYIVNLDFTNEQFNKYIIERKAVVFNLVEERLTLPNTFCGMIVNQIHITYGERIKQYFLKIYQKGECQENLLYRSLINIQMPFSMIENKLIQDNVKITQLIGNNGILSFQEIRENVVKK